MPFEIKVKTSKESKPSSKDVVTTFLRVPKSKQLIYNYTIRENTHHFPSVDVTQKHCMCVCKITTEGQIPPSATTQSICKHNKFEYVALSRA